MRDPRHYQILFLGILLSAGAWLRDFSLRPEQVVLTFLAGISTQILCERARGGRPKGLLSAVITCFSLTILLRADNLFAHPAAACGAIASKFLIRFREKHLFNPGNLGIIAALLTLPGTWTSPGQWGHDLAFAGWFVALGSLVASRARRADTSFIFLSFFLGIAALRVAWLGQAWAVWLHQLTSGSLLLFAFFMISDPMTIPDHRRGRVVHGALAATLASAWQYVLFRPNGVLFALFLLAPAVPILDLVWPAPKFAWPSTEPKGVAHVAHSTAEPVPDPALPASRGGALGHPLPGPTL